MKQDVWFDMNRASANVDEIKVYIIQSKYGITMNGGFECEELYDWGSCKNDYIWYPSACDCACNKACKIDQCLDIENCSCENV